LTVFGDRTGRYGLDPELVLTVSEDWRTRPAPLPSDEATLGE
jgi:hypothetical protein